MAKRKRASLKDKSSEGLGLTPKKGKGLDLLFGGPTELQESTNQPVESVSNLSGLHDSSVVNASIGGDLVDELGLPVAMEEPPDDLILASSLVEPAVLGEQDAADLSTSPFAMPNSSLSSAGDPNDLSGLAGEANSPKGEDGNLTSSFDENDLSGLVDEGTSAGSAGMDDLSGLMENDSGLGGDLSGLVGGDAGIDDLSGLVLEETGTDDLSGLVVNDTGMMVPAGPATPVSSSPAPAAPTPAPSVPTPAPAPLPVTPPIDASPPPTTAAPIGIQPLPGSGSVVPPAPMPVTPPVGGPTAPTYADPSAMSVPPGPVSSIPPPSTATGAPDLTPPRPLEPVKLDAVDENVVGTIAAFGTGLTREDFKPKDELPDYELVVKEDKRGELDAATQQRILEYIGAKRRDELFERIQDMHGRVAKDLSGNKADVSFALDTLREANEYIIQRPYEYDEALYRVALVETMLNRKKKLSRSSYWMGIPILLYGIFWTIICLLGYAYPPDFTSMGIDPNLVPIFQAVWLSGLAGGLGGTVEVFWRLYYRVSIKQDFDPQYLMYYIVKPVLGFVLGLVMYFLVSVGTSFGGGGAIQATDNPTGLGLTLLFGFIAGFRQEFVFDMIYVIINKIAPDNKKGKGVSSVVPVDEIKTSEITTNTVLSPNASSGETSTSVEITATNPSS